MIKRYNINAVVILLLLAGSLVYMACSDMERDWNAKLVEYPEITIAGFTPAQGRPGTQVTITGTNFGDRLEAAVVTFNGVPVTTYMEYADTKMIVEVPEDAGTGRIAVKVWTHSKTFESDFAYIPGHKVTGISATIGSPGDPITITGSNFGSDVSAVTVRFGSAEAQIESITDTEIVVTVPECDGGLVTVEIDRQVVDAFWFIIGGKLTGTIIGHSGSYQNNPATTINAALDGDLNTFVDAAGNPGYVGYDFGDMYAAKLTTVKYCPRSTHASRMTGGEIRGSNDPSLAEYTVLHTITAQPPIEMFTTVTISTDHAFRYVYYYASSGNCNIAELEFYGALIEQELPVGKLIYEFDTDGDNEGWVPQQSAAWVVEGGLLKVTFPQTSGNKRSDLKGTTPIIVHTGNYPIVAMKFTKPAGARVTLDTNLKEVGGGYNKYYTDFADKDVYYWDLSVQTMNGTVYTDQEITFSTFQFKIADTPESDPAKGYEISWIRTFSSVSELQAFISN